MEYKMLFTPMNIGTVQIKNRVVMPPMMLGLSSNVDTAIERNVCMAGEVGLSGEIRPVTRIAQRIAEAEKLGFSRFILPDANLKGLEGAKRHIELIPYSLLHRNQ